MKGDYITKKKPRSSDGLIRALKAGVSIDRRTYIGKAITDVKRSIQDDLYATAEALLISDISNSTIIAQLAFDRAMSERDNIITDDGKVSEALNTYSKWIAIKRSGLLALKQFQRHKKQPKKDKSLADVILETTEIETMDEPGP